MTDNVTSTPKLSLQKTSDTNHAVVSGGNIWKPEDKTVSTTSRTYSSYGYSGYGLGGAITKIFFIMLPVPLILFMALNIPNIIHALDQVYTVGSK